MRLSLFVYCAPLFCFYVLRPLVWSHSNSLHERHRRVQLLPHARAHTHWCGWIYTMTAHPRANTAIYHHNTMLSEYLSGAVAAVSSFTQIHWYYILLKLRCYNSRRLWCILLLKQSTKSKKKEPTNERPHCQICKPWNSCTPFIWHRVASVDSIQSHWVIVSSLACHKWANKYRRTPLPQWKWVWNACHKQIFHATIIYEFNHR